MQYIEGIPVCGPPDEGAVRQITALRPTVEYAALLADHHLGYVVPIGGVVASQELLSLAGVGYDICCGNKAVRLDADPVRVKQEIPQIMDRIAAEISFGLGWVRGWELEVREGALLPRA